MQTIEEKYKQPRCQRCARFLKGRDVWKDAWKDPGDQKSILLLCEKCKEKAK
jgi:hypothetical protein